LRSASNSSTTTDRICDVTALGLDETLFAKLGRFRTQSWSTQIVDVRRDQLLDVVGGQDCTGAVSLARRATAGVAGSDRVGDP